MRPASGPADPGRRPVVAFLVRRGRRLWPGLIFAGLGCVHAQRSTDLAPRPAPDAVAQATGELSASCRAAVAEMFRTGERGPTCREERRAVARKLARDEHPSFGVLDQRRVDLRGFSLVLLRADRCDEWLLRAPRHTVATRSDAVAAGCRLRRFEGALEIAAVRGDGDAYTDALHVEADEGVVRVSFAGADAVLRERGLAGLGGFTELQLGDSAWAGTIHLERLREFLGLWHFVWVVRGRGSPGLFAALHPEHSRGGDVRALAVEENLARQEREYLSVARGELAADRFLERHVWSPYRRSVAAMAGAIPVPEVRVDAPEAGREPAAPAQPAEAGAPSTEPSTPSGSTRGP